MSPQVDGRTTNQRVLVTGGTGTLGRKVVELLVTAGADVRILSRTGGQRTAGVEVFTGDLATGHGVNKAAEGVSTVVHLAGSAKGDETKALNMVRAASRAGVSHLVFISVVGADHIPVVSPIDRAMFGYFGSQAKAEQVIAESGLPYTTLRATQFHQLIFMVAQQLAKLPVMPSPAGISFQPIDAAEVAARLTELSLAEPAGLVPAMAGPQVHSMRELLRSYTRAAGLKRLILPVWQPGAAARAFRSGANLAPERGVGIRTWEEFLTDSLNDRTDQRHGNGRLADRAPL